MKSSGRLRLLVYTSAIFLILTFSASAHCDSMEGPVIKAAIKSLETGNINYSLIWIPEKDEPELIRLFEQALKVRELNSDARTLADRYFYETLVRIHRMGEGAGYTGIKPEGFKIEQGIIDADKALESGSIEDVINHVPKDQADKISHLFAETTLKKDFDLDDVDAGREYVESYVHFIHAVEEIYASGKSCNMHQ